jgi:CARDB
LDFFDEDDPAENPEPAHEARRGRRGGRGGDVGAPSSQQIMTRRLTLIGVSVVVLILLFLAFKGCLDARKERAFKNYNSDLTALTAETKQLSDGFFAALNGDSQNGDISLTNQVNGDRGTAQGLLDRAKGLDAPDQVAGAQTEIVLSYQLRYDALEEISKQLPAALGTAGSKKATKAIAEQMKVFVASDVLFARARRQIEEALSNEEIVVDGGVPESVFLPTGKNDPDYLNADEVAVLLSGASTGTGTGGGSASNCDPGDGLTHGLGLVSTTAQPSGVVLQPGASASVPADAVEFEVSVQNQGEAPESDIKVTLSGDFSGTQRIGSIEAGATESVTIVPKPTPSAGESAELTVTVDTVCGEQVAENNVSEPPYQISFG